MAYHGPALHGGAVRGLITGERGMHPVLQARRGPRRRRGHGRHGRPVVRTARPRPRVPTLCVPQVIDVKQIGTAGPAAAGDRFRLVLSDGQARLGPALRDGDSAHTRGSRRACPQLRLPPS